VNDLALLNVLAVDGSRLLAAVESDWHRPVPTCPGWDGAELVRHTGGIFAWISSIITAGECVGRRVIDHAPVALDDLSSWYTDNLHRILDQLRRADTASEVWTFSTAGDRRVAWWRRRLAVEVAIHRWDAEHAITLQGGPPPAPLDGAVAAAGIEEFVTEFLPAYLDQSGGSAPRGVMRLHATDGQIELFIDLDARGVLIADHTDARATAHGSCSDILLWMTNRRPTELELLGESMTLEAWKELRR
jgi:uncharacterized protein (TIGR03083 family)